MEGVDCRLKTTEPLIATALFGFSYSTLALWDYVGSLQTFGTLFNREFHRLPFFQTTVSVHLDGGKVDENILTVITANKTIAFGGIKPLYGPNKTFSHIDLHLPFLKRIKYFAIPPSTNHL
jgi:hypothetical protein